MLQLKKFLLGFSTLDIKREWLGQILFNLILFTVNKLLQHLNKLVCDDNLARDLKEQLYLNY